MDNRIFLFDSSAKFKELCTAKDITFLEPGEVKECANWRWADDVGLESRLGVGAAIGTVVANATFKGYGVFTISGTVWHLVAVRVSTATRIYASNDDGVTWAEQTATTGAYGDTRMDTDAPVYFELISTNYYSSNRRWIVCQNGTDRPILISPHMATPVCINTYNDIGADMDARSRPIKYGAGVNLSGVMQSWKIRDYNETNGAITNDNASFALANTTTSSTVNAMTLTATAAIAGQYNAEAIFDTPVTIPQGCKQMWIVADSDVADWWKDVEVRIGTATGATGGEIWDPSNAADYQEPFAVPMGIINDEGVGVRNCWVFSIPPDFSGLSGFDVLVFQWKNAAPAATQVLTIRAIAFGGARDTMEPEFGIAYGDSYIASQSPGVVFGKKEGVLLSEIGGAIGTNERLPLSPFMFYGVSIPFTAMSTVDRDRGISQVVVYRRGEGQSEFIVDEAFVLATYSGSWSFSGSYTADDPFRKVLTGLTLPAGLNATMPSAYHQNIPVGKKGVVASGRYIVPGASRVWISRLDAHNVFSEFSEPDQGIASPTSHAVSGETGQCAVQTATDNFNISQVYVFTDKWLYSIRDDVNRLRRIAPHGTGAPESVREYRGLVMWLAPHGQVMQMFGGNPVDVSNGKVDDITTAIPSTRVPYVWGEFFKDRYRLYCSADGGSTNTVGLVYSLDRRVWEATDSWSGVTVEALLRREYGASEKAFMLTQAAVFHEYEKAGQTTDAGSNIATALTWPAFTDRKVMFSGITLGRAWLFADANSATHAFVRTFWPGEGTISGSVVVPETSGYSWKIEGALTTAGDASNALYAMVRMSASISTRQKIRQIAMEATATESKPSA